MNAVLHGNSWQIVLIIIMHDHDVRYAEFLLKSIHFFRVMYQQYFSWRNYCTVGKVTGLNHFFKNSLREIHVHVHGVTGVTLKTLPI